MSQRRQITDSEKKEILKSHGRVCFIDGAPIEETEGLEFHHIRPYSKDGPTTIDNIAPVCAKHHRTIGTMSLQEYRDKQELERFFDGDSLRYLDDLIRTRHGRYGEKVPREINDGSIRLYLSKSVQEFPLYRCPTTGWRYFYAILPVENIGNDRELQPRALRMNSLWNLYRHFQGNTQLAPSICRFDETGIIVLFDGQHKAAAQIWAGRPDIECKVYVDPDPRVLKETNLEAHGKFRQMSFYSHELMRKYADILGSDWIEYMETEGEKSEQGFFTFLVRTKNKTTAQARNEILQALYSRVIDDPENKLSAYLPEKNRTRTQPLTFSRVRKTLLTEMLIQPPVADEFESDTDFRQVEQRNLVRFMNILAEEGLEGRWNPDMNDAMHQRTQRVFSAGAVRAWTILLRDAINAHLHHYSEDERRRFFYRHVSDDDFKAFRGFVSRLFGHKLWDDPDPTGQITARLSRDDASTAKSLFDERGITVHWLLGLPS